MRDLTSQEIPATRFLVLQQAEALGSSHANNQPSRRSILPNWSPPSEGHISLPHPPHPELQLAPSIPTVSAIARTDTLNIDSIPS